MHPAYSVILFTTTSGAGYGLLVWLAVLAAFGPLAPDVGFGLISLALALGLVSIGLLSSTFHLGHPERAWRAFSQWRSSWLSREGIVAVATYLPAAIFAFGWIYLERTDGFFGLMGLAAAVLALLTVYCTGMIYASLRTIRQWHQPLVPWIYMALALMTGGLLMLALGNAFGLPMTTFVFITLGAIAVAGVLKERYWAQIDGEARTWTISQATGLGTGEDVRVLDPPHAQANYIMREMGYEVARSHAQKLRQISRVLAFFVPALLTLLTLILGPMLAALASCLAVLSAAIGVAVERWLFFAEAEHISMLYYGRPAA